MLLLRRCSCPYFNPLPPHGGRQCVPARSNQREQISIHSLRMEGDILYHKCERLSIISIHSLRMEGDLPHDHNLTISSEISIHSLRMEGDIQLTAKGVVLWYFNPLPPHGGRLSEF